MRTFRFGEAREDGMLFHSYRPNGTEKWMSVAAYDAAKKRKAERARVLIQTPKEQARRRAYSAKQREIVRAYKAANPKRVLAWSARRHKSERIAHGASPEFIRQFYLTRDRLARCTGLSWHVDHITALSRGGLHHERNLQVLPAKINSRKHAK